MTDPTRAVYFRGPDSHQDRHGNELPFWSVYVGDMNADPESLKKIYRIGDYKRALALALSMAADRYLELINEATED